MIYASGSIRLSFTSYIKILAIVFVSLVNICTFGYLGHDEDSIQTRNGLIFFNGDVFVWYSIQFVILVFPDERPVFIKEFAAGLYTPTAYYLAKFTSEVPMMIVFVMLNFCLTYLGTGMNTESSKQPITYISYSLLLIWTSTAFGFFGGIAIEDRQVAAAMFPVLSTPMLIVVSNYFCLINLEWIFRKSKQHCRSLATLRIY